MQLPRKFGMGQSLVERQFDRLPWSGVERGDAAQTSRVGISQEDVHQCHGVRRQAGFGGVLVAGWGDGIEIPPPKLIEAAAAHDGGRARSAAGSARPRMNARTARC